jgi:hypothetical protein
VAAPPDFAQLLPVLELTLVVEALRVGAMPLTAESLQ